MTVIKLFYNYTAWYYYTELIFNIKWFTYQLTRLQYDQYTYASLTNPLPRLPPTTFGIPQPLSYFQRPRENIYSEDYHTYIPAYVNNRYPGGCLT